MSRVVVVGNAMADVTLRVPALPPAGGDVVATDGGVTAGGAVNVVAAAARQGVNVGYAGTHGTGPFGDLVRAALAAEGAEVLLPRHTGDDTGFDVAVTDAAGERTFLTRWGAEASLAGEQLAAVRPDDGDVVVVSGYVLANPGPAAAVAAWVRGLAPGVVVVVDPGPLVASLPADALAVLAERADWWSASTGELASGPVGRRGVVERAGAEGAVLRAPGQPPLVVPALPVDVVDTNGAGDAHVGVLAAGLAQGRSPADAVRRATVAASLAVARPGPATCPRREDIEAALQELGRAD